MQCAQRQNIHGYINHGAHLLNYYNINDNDNDNTAAANNNYDNNDNDKCGDVIN
jgi:hypothetical protein